MNAAVLLLLALSQKADEIDLVQSRMEAKGEVWVGQRVTMVVKLYSPTFFAGAASFDLPTVPGVVILPPQGSPTLGSETIGDDTYTVQRHELAVYPQQPGAVRLPPIRVRFASDGGIGKPPVPRQGATKETTFAAKMPPGAEGLSTVITTPKLTVRETWKPEPGKAKVGSAFTRTVTVRATDVPSMVLPPMRWSDGGGLAVYPAPPALTDATERGESAGQRVETVTYVCEKPGTFLVPALTLTWWNAGEKKLEQARLPARTFDVSPTTVTSEPEPPDAAGGRPPVRVWLPVTVTAVVACLLAWAWFDRARLREWWQRHRLARATSEKACFARFRQACASGEPHAVYRTLTAWLDQVPGAITDSPLDRLASRSGDLELTTQLGGLERELYGRPGEGHSVTWSADHLFRAVSRARRGLLDRSSTAHAMAGLPPLNP